MVGHFFNGYLVLSVYPSVSYNLAHLVRLTRPRSRPLIHRDSIIGLLDVSLHPRFMAASTGRAHQAPLLSDSLVGTSCFECPISYTRPCPIQAIRRAALSGRILSLSNGNLTTYVAVTAMSLVWQQSRGSSTVSWVTLPSECHPKIRLVCSLLTQ